MCLSTCINMAIPFCSFSGMGGTPPSVSGRQPNSYARGRSTATTSTHQVSYLVNTKLINYLTVFLPFSVLRLQMMSLSLVSCFIDICYNSILVIKGLFCFICHFHHLFAKICFTVWFCTLCLFLFAMDMFQCCFVNYHKVLVHNQFKMWRHTGFWVVLLRWWSIF